ncbi:MAG: spheroidene monooxygenase [Adhaeribacter sp.]
MSLTTLTIFRLQPGTWRWGLAQMGSMPPRLRQVPGLNFFKMLGSGKDRVFSLRPDFYQYGLMATWESAEAADHFLHHSPVLDSYRARSSEMYSLFMQPLRAHGLWDGGNPFIPIPGDNPPPGPLAVLTRASIRWKALPAFWRYGAKTSQDLQGAPGLLAAVGLGELPLVRQATFSLWTHEEAMNQYAYGTAHHKQVIRKTRADRWYKEELFARFRVLSSSGTWNGRNPLDNDQFSMTNDQY